MAFIPPVPVPLMHLPLPIICFAVLGSSVLLSVLSFDPYMLASVTGLTLGIAGLAWCCLPHSLRLGEVSLLLALGIGLAMRVVYFASDPIREIDFLRYLWDAGAVQAGLNPFSVGPADAIAGHAGPEWAALAARSGGIAQGISYGNLATIYPPVAQFAFWIAHQFDPWGITGLRAVFLAAEMAGIWLLILLLREVNLSPSWIAIYWWNPLIAKEIINSAHMDALLLPALAGALLLAVRARPILSGVALAIAAGVKVWPLILAPVLIWQGRWRTWVAAGVVLVVATAVIFTPMALGRLDNQSGLVAYAGVWERNHALFGALREALAWSLYKLDMLHLDPNRLTRIVMVTAIGITALILGWRLKERNQIPAAALTVAALLLLFSPTAYPWYYVWILPFLCIVPSRGLMLLGALLPFYYLRFDMVLWQNTHLFDRWIVWLEFGPVLALLTYDWLTGRDRT
jgi:hypothetical protein